MLKYNAIIFDLDGVICSTDKYHYQAWKKIAEEEGIYFDEEINKRLRGVSRMESLQIILEKANKEYTQEEQMQLAQKKNEIYVELLGQMTEECLGKDIKDTLQKLRKIGLKLAIGSSSKNAKFILKKLGLDNFFDAVSDGSNISFSKPHPEVFIKAVDMLNERPYDCLVVEDAMAGIEAAYRGGFQTAGIGDAGNHIKVTYKIQNISELLEIVTGE